MFKRFQLFLEDLGITFSERNFAKKMKTFGTNSFKKNFRKKIVTGSIE